MTTYTVKSGDWISKIALTVYGTYQPIGSWDPLKAIAAANPQVANINVISPGQVINIPDKPSTSTQSNVPAQNTSSNAGTATNTTKTPPAQSSGNSKMILTILGSIALGAAAFFGYKAYKKRKAKKNG